MLFDGSLAQGEEINWLHSQIFTEQVAVWLCDIRNLTYSSCEPENAWEIYLEDLFSPESSLTPADKHKRYLQLYSFVAQARNLQDWQEVQVSFDPPDLSFKFDLAADANRLIFCGSSTYCVTSSGKFGRCDSRSVQPNDLVCLIPSKAVHKSGQRLHIFRPVPERKTVRRVATAWFCGWSNGEAADMINNGRISLTTINIE